MILANIIAVAEYRRGTASYFETDWLYASTVSLEWLRAVSGSVSAGISREQLGCHQSVRGNVTSFHRARERSSTYTGKDQVWEGMGNWGGGGGGVRAMKLNTLTRLKQKVHKIIRLY